MPVLTRYVYTKTHRIIHEALDLPRTGIYAKWQRVMGEVIKEAIYKAAGVEISRPHTAFTINKGHCQPWIMLACSVDGVILSNTYTFNAAIEYEGQNLGTEIANEDTCRIRTGWNGG